MQFKYNKFKYKNLWSLCDQTFDLYIVADEIGEERFFYINK